ncbi:MAG: three-Cys-motif partner protein TcmP [Gammaproteobacteria bacterium]|nr:three-Cys-motif partner protein TcmP [Gammaproteobacteria bacterium]
MKAYLQKLFMIIGMSASRLGIREICYVDGFAGPWSSTSENLADTSIGISLSILSQCKADLSKVKQDLRFRALFVEKDKKVFSKLNDFLEKWNSQELEANAFQGDFVSLLGQIQEWCGTRAFVFFFLDPKGWKDVRVDMLSPLLRRRQSEFLINFMYENVNRTASMVDWNEKIAALLGEPVDMSGLDGSSREKLLVDTYRKNLKRELAASESRPARSAHVRVLDRKRERPKYHLVYLTSHPRGIVEFMQISENLQQIQKLVRAATKQVARVTRSGQNELFDGSDLVDLESGNVGNEVVQAYWLNYLAGGDKRIGEEQFADILEQTGWFPGDFQRALVRLIEVGAVRNLDAKGKRPKQPLHWKDGERLSLMERSQ